MKTDTDVLFSRKRTGAADPSVNINKAVLICNLFHFFFAASKACLLPFLTVFLRRLGMTATETGIIIAFKTITGFVWAPLWARCAISYNKRRFVLMFSVLMFAASYLSLTVVYQHTSNYDMCNNSLDSSNRLVLPSYLKPLFGSDSSKSNDKIPANPQYTSAIPENTSTNPKLASEFPESTSTISMSTNVPSTTTNLPTTELPTTLSMKTTIGTVIPPINEPSTPSQDQLLQVAQEEESQAQVKQESQTQANHRVKRSIKSSWDDAMKRSESLWTNMDSEKIQLFLLVLLVIIIGELLSCAIEKVADDSWFDFLDRIDDLEKYGKQRLGGNFAFVFFPIGISLLVHYTDCMLPLYINHFLLHFYMFGGFLAITFVVAFFYPIPPPQKQEFNSKVVQGLKIICCDCQAFLYILTLLIMGLVYSSYHNFLFWVIEDLGGGELNMGMCVSIGAFAEIPMLMISQKMVKKMGNAGVVSLALFFLSMRVLYYSFLPTPWAVMPAELLHAFTHTAMWFAVLSYDDFNVGAMIDRSIRSILSSIYFGVGFTLGCLISGLIYDIFGYAILYQAASVLVGIWFIIFSIISKCIPKKERIRYVKLLHAGDTDESDSVEDDWLEMALKDN
ncbi:hypothetical protein LOTGIDRAFT_106318 [Lottia gigantea]|uniref:Major facilitator superfamily associated domain-containing protein n=1 Tax=Lottia gigantea TaxID=225164 RepID=V3ZXX0_LOTGI|nr:hypothetical protein LOTGIDRAFT_106318 [Lottia gigantea]ESO89262.1 hypothetical protein LOTGIDRAFT_106318 [Lottia gigantea]